MGLVHIYHGSGKGKSTASIGLALRALGAGHQVYFQQFLKDGMSSELTLLESLGAIVSSGMPEGAKGFTWNMNEEQLAKVHSFQNEKLEKIILYFDKNKTKGVIVLDEALASLALGLLDEEKILDLIAKVHQAEDGPDLVLTGRNPSEDLLALADYVSEIKAVKHPFDKGIAARRGIEF